VTENPDRSDRANVYQVKVLDKALDILDAFTLAHNELSMREIVQATGLNRSTAIRLVANLERRGVLQQASTPGRYRLGRRLFEMGGIVCASFSLVEAAALPLSALQKRVAATIVLAVRHGDHSVTIDRRQGATDGFATVPTLGEVGTVQPLTHGCVGQVFLAALPPETVDELMGRYPPEQLTPSSVTDRRRLLERLPRVRADGYAIDVNEVMDGLMAVATPILDFAGKTAGALALGFPSTRGSDGGFLDSAIRNLKQAAGEVSANMGYGGEAHSFADLAPSPETALTG
jgi:DNA-binding IclR family transcriptional regulator